MRRHQLLSLGSVTIGVVLAPSLAGTAAAAAPATILAPTVTAVTTSITWGAPATFRFREPAGGVTPASFVWQLNVNRSQQVTATGRHAIATVIPDKQVDTLSVYAVAADGSLSNATTIVFGAAAPPPKADQDLNGDGRPDLLTVGGTAGLPAGLWQATGRAGQGQVTVPAVDVGADGNGVAGDDSPSDFTGGQAITGKFTGGPFEDFFVYYPSGNNAGMAVILNGLGDGAVVPPVSGREHTVSSGMLSDLNGDNPLQVVNAYDGSGNHLLNPDLLGVVGSPTNGYTLDYYPAMGGIGFFDLPVPVAVTTPAGGSDWNSWRLASKLLSSGTAVALWNESTGALYLWEGVTFDANAGTLSYTQYTLATNWLTGVDVSTLQLTDVNADGVPDLWAVKPDGTVTAYVVKSLSTTGPAKIVVKAAQPLS